MTVEVSAPVEIRTEPLLSELSRPGTPGHQLPPLDVPLADEEGPSAGERLADSDRWTHPDEQVELRESADEVRAALARLPTAQRVALTLHYFQDMRYEDIAETMGLPLNTVKSHIRRGKERMAVLLQAAPPEEPRCSAPV